MLTSHCKILVPLAKAVTALLGADGLAILAEPSNTLQLPEPAVGVLAAKVVVGLLMHKVWLGPAAAVIGVVFTVTVIAAVPVQAPLVPDKV